MTDEPPSWGVWGRIWPASPAPCLSIYGTGYGTGKPEALALPRITRDYASLTHDQTRAQPQPFRSVLSVCFLFGIFFLSDQLGDYLHI